MGLFNTSKGTPLLRQESSSDAIKPLVLPAHQPLFAPMGASMGAGTTTGESTCTLCSQPCTRPAVGSCYHEFCHGCLLDACATGLVECPTCHCPINAIRPLAVASAEPRFTRMLEMPPGCHAGVTLQRRNQGPGDTISELHQQDQASKCGLRLGDVLLSINGEAVGDPEDGTRMIDALTTGKSARGSRGPVTRALLTIIPQADAEYRPPPLLARNKSSSSFSQSA